MTDEQIYRDWRGYMLSQKQPPEWIKQTKPGYLPSWNGFVAAWGKHDEIRRTLPADAVSTGVKRVSEGGERFRAGSGKATRKHPGKLLRGKRSV